MSRNNFFVGEHPLTTLSEIAGRKSITTFNLRTYEDQDYGAGFRDVETFKVPAEAIVEEGLRRINDAEKAGLDLVVDSLVGVRYEVNRKTPLHLGMIDFAISAEDVNVDALAYNLRMPADFGQLSKEERNVAACTLEAQTGVNPYNDMHFYRSGRSYHGYVVSTLFTEAAWAEFMAKLLIVRPLATRDVVDVRWVGRRLLQKTGALRLSCVSDRYLTPPIRVAPQTPKEF